MRYKSSVWKKVSLVGIAFMAVSLLLPVSSRAIDTPDQVVLKFLKQSMGKTPTVTIEDPVCDAGGACTINVRVSAAGRRQALATVMADKMATNPNKSYGDTDSVTIQVVDSDGNIEPPAAIEGTTEDEQVRNFRSMMNSLFTKNKLFIRATSQNPPQVDGERLVGVYLNCQRTLVQPDINDERDWFGRANFLAQDIFSLFLKPTVQVNPDDAGAGSIALFTTTSK